jgi:cytoskeletal protein CcmA (bactofilin family)
MIGPGTTIRGTISGDEDLVIEGRVEGAVRLTKSLEVAQGAHLAASIEATQVDVAGTVHGDINAPEGVHIAADAEVVGDVTSQQFVLAEGGRFTGRVVMDFEVPGGEPEPKQTRRR